MGSYVQIQYFSKNPMFVGSSFLNKDPNFQINAWSNRRDSLFTPKKQFQLKYGRRRYKWRGQLIVCNGFLFQLDQWASNVDSPALASLLSAFSLLPYMGFLYFITKSKSAPKLTLFGFYFLLVFVGGAIPAGIYGNFLPQEKFTAYLNQTLHNIYNPRTAKVHYLTSLANVDWLHGGAESLLMLTNLFIVLGLREGIRKAEDKTRKTLSVNSRVKEEDKS